METVATMLDRADRETLHAPCPICHAARGQACLTRSSSWPLGNGTAAEQTGEQHTARRLLRLSELEASPCAA